MPRDQSQRRETGGGGGGFHEILNQSTPNVNQDLPNVTQWPMVQQKRLSAYPVSANYEGRPCLCEHGELWSLEADIIFVYMGDCLPPLGRGLVCSNSLYVGWRQHPSLSLTELAREPT